MTQDVIDNAVSATVTTGGTDAPSPGTSQTWTVTTASNWDVLGAGQVMRLMDKADLGKTTGYEIMEATANANGTLVSWTVTRGVEGTTPYAHAPGWTVIPVLSSAGLDGRYVQSTEPVNVVASAGATETLPAPSTYIGNDFTLSANLTVTMPTARRGAFCYAICRQAASGGPYTVTFTSVKWPGGVAPTMSAGASALDRYDFASDGTSWYGVIAGQAFA